MSVVHSTTKKQNQEQKVHDSFLEDVIRQSHLKNQTCKTRIELCQTSRSLVEKYRKEKKENNTSNQEKALKEYREHGIRVQDCIDIRDYHVNDCLRQGFAPNGVHLTNSIAVGGWDNSSPTEDFYAVVLGTSGSVICFGKNKYERAPPEGIPTDAENPFVSVSAGPLHFAALRKDGSIACRGEFPTGPNIWMDGDWSKVPDIQPDPGNKYIAISAGLHDFPLLAIREDGSLVIFFDELIGTDGSDTLRRAIVKPESPENPFIAVEAYHAWVLRKDGSLFRILRGPSTQRDDPTLVKSTIEGTFVALSRGSSRVLATCALLKGQHSFVVLGENPETVTVDKKRGDGEPSPIVSLSSGTRHWIALHADGSLSYNDFRTEQQITFVDADLTDPYVEVAAGQSVSLALHASGSIRVFGEWSEPVRKQYQEQFTFRTFMQ